MSLIVDSRHAFVPFRQFWFPLVHDAWAKPGRVGVLIDSIFKRHFLEAHPQKQRALLNNSGFLLGISRMENNWKASQKK